MRWLPEWLSKKEARVGESVEGARGPKSGRCRRRLTFVVRNVKHSASGGGDGVGSVNLEVGSATGNMANEAAHEPVQQCDLGAGP